MPVAYAVPLLYSLGMLGTAFYMQHLFLTQMNSPCVSCAYHQKAHESRKELGRVMELTPVPPEMLWAALISFLSIGWPVMWWRRLLHTRQRHASRLGCTASPSR